MSADKRKSTRLDIPLEMHFKPTGSPGEYISGVTRDFSREGFSFETESFDFEPEKALEFKVRLPEQESFAHMVGAIRWTNKAGGKCLVGVKLSEIDAGAKSEILTHAYNNWWMTTGVWVEEVHKEIEN